MRYIVPVILILAILGLVAGCTNGSSTGEVPAKTGKIVCHAAYRASVTVPIEREETITFTDSDARQSISFADLDCHAQYGTGELDGERALRLWVTAAEQPDTLISQLYQLPLELFDHKTSFAAGMALLASTMPTIPPRRPNCSSGVRGSSPA